jgi:hypothetical protein
VACVAWPRGDVGLVTAPALCFCVARSRSPHGMYRASRGRRGACSLTGESGLVVSIE